MKILEILTKKRSLGNRGESEACRYLKKHGYKILKRNFVAADAEIDIVAECAEATVFVEVKTRTEEAQSPHEARPASAVTPEKQRKIIKAAKFFPRNPAKAMRFDIIEVIYSKKDERRPVEINHLISTFNYNSAHRR